MNCSNGSTSSSPYPRFNVLGVGVTALTADQAVEQIGRWIEERRRTYVVVCPVYTVMQCTERPTLRRMVNRAGMVAPDGMPLVFLGRWMGYRLDRVYGPDLMLAFSAVAAERGYRPFYYGGAEGVADDLAKVLARRFPGLRIAGSYAPPFRRLTPDEENEIADRINAAHPDVVWVGIGSTRQEEWMAAFRDRLNAPVLIGVGVAFDIHTGRIPQAPRWMQQTALEWLFRLAIEPRRLWRRYLIYNPLFLLYVALQWLGLRNFPLDDVTN